MSELTHIDAEGRARMVDVGAKAETARTARAEGSITMSLEALDAIEQNALAKGDAIATARIAGIMAAKRTAELIHSVIRLRSPTPEWTWKWIAHSREFTSLRGHRRPEKPESKWKR